MNRLLSVTFALGALILGGSTASGAQISGTVSFTALTPAIIDNLTLANVNTLTFTPGVNAFVASGFATTDDFDAYEGAPVHFESFSVNAAAGNLLWTLGLGNLQFVMSTASNDSPASNSGLVIAGTGTVSGGGWDPTPGTFAVTAPRSQFNQQLILVFNAQSDSLHGDPAPDAGATAILLGLGIIGIGALSRRLKA